MTEPDISRPLPDKSHELLRLHALWVSDELASLRTRLSAGDIRDDADEIRDRTLQSDVDDLQMKVAGPTARVDGIATPTTGD